jgi:hypothetical protein
MHGEYKVKHNEKFHSLYSVADIIGMNKLSRMKWEWYVACTMKIRNVYKIFIRELKGRDNLRYMENTIIINLK